MDPVTKFQWCLVLMQLLAFVFGMLFERAIERGIHLENEDEKE